jgi:hypothetical protein
MRRIKLILGVSAVMMAMMIALAAPAMADDRNCDDFFFDDCNNNNCDFFDCNNNNNDNFCDDDFFDNCGFDRFGFDDGFGDFEQDADSGDVDQSFDVTGGGDNSNQTVGLQGVANTGNAQNQIGITQFGQDGDFNDFDPNRNFFHNDGFFNDFNNNRFDGNGGDFEFNDVGSSIEVSPMNTTTSDQQVNQAASVFGK